MNAKKNNKKNRSCPRKVSTHSLLYTLKGSDYTNFHMVNTGSDIGKQGGTPSGSINHCLGFDVNAKDVNFINHIRGYKSLRFNDI